MSEHKQPEEQRDLLHEDPLRVARGIAWGVILGSAMWAIIIGVFLLWIIN